MPASTKKFDLSRLTKVLALTASPVDNEALVAARTAVKLLNDANLTFHDVLADKPGHVISPNDSRAEILNAWMMIRDLRNEVNHLRAQVEGGQIDGTSGLRRLRSRLLNEISLKRWERQALAQIKEIRPRSREEFYVRWLARRYALAD